MSVQPLPPPTGSDPPLAPTGPLTVGDLLDRAFRLYRVPFRTLPADGRCPARPYRHRLRHLPAAVLCQL